MDRIQYAWPAASVVERNPTLQKNLYVIKDPLRYDFGKETPYITKWCALYDFIEANPIFIIYDVFTFDEFMFCNWNIL